MTAIFAVWNNIGFSLASDSNQSVEQNNQTWIDPVEKIIMLEKHQIAIAGAGASLHEGVEVNEIFRSWEKTLPDEGFITFDDYFVNFTNWYSSQELTNSVSSLSNFSEEVGYWFSEIYEELGEDFEEEGTLDDYYSSQARTSRTDLNFYGGYWNIFADESELVDNVLADAYTSIQKLYDKYYIDYRSSINHENFEISQHRYFESELSPIIVDKFTEIFKVPFDENNEAHQRIATLVLLHIENRLTVEGPVKIMFIGYGKLDWMPTGVKFDLVPTFFGVPRLRIVHVSDPSQNWYLALATESAVVQLTSGHSRERGREIIELAEPHLKKGHKDSFEIELGKIMNDKFHNSLARIDNLTLSRLEFVSRLFVQIEALKSFLDEPVPGVGGDTQVISMTKTTRVQRHYRELD